MGRILRHTLLEDDVYGIDLGFTKPGKLLIRNASTRDVRIGYDPYDVGALGVNYFTIEAGITYVFDMSQAVGFLAQNQLLYFNCDTADNAMEFWLAYDS